MTLTPSQSHLFSPASLACASAQPYPVSESSRHLSWRHLLVDHHQGTGKSGVFDTHPTDDLTLVVATHGRSMVQVHKHGRWLTVLYEAGAGGAIAPQDTNRLFWQALDGDDRFDTAHIYLSSVTMGEVAEEYRRTGSRHFDRPLCALVFRDPTIAALGSEILNAMREEAPSIYAEHMAGFLAAHILARHAGWWDPDSDRRMPSMLGDRQLARVLDFMSSHLADNLTLAQLAGEACISVHHFVRRFRERMGVTPFAYLTRLRIEAAQRMLRTSDVAIAEVSGLCGYSDAGAFSSATSALRLVRTACRPDFG